MKKISFLVLVSLLTGAIYAQDALKEVKLMAAKQDWLKAKTAIDKVLADPKTANLPEAWYWKGGVYNSLASNPELKKACTDCRMDAFEALKKYQQLDSSNKEMKDDKNAFLFDMYGKYFDDAIACFGTNDYAGALINFKNALIVKEYVYGKGFESQTGFKFPALDTSLILNCAIAARNDKKDDLAMPYYQILADANVAEDKFLEVYEILADYYAEKKDMPAFESAIEKGRAIFPKEEYWEAKDLETQIKGVEKPQLFDVYEKMVGKYPASYDVMHYYSVELFRYIYSDDAKGVNLESYKTKLKLVMQKALEIQSSAEMNYLAATYYYNNWYDTDQEAKLIKGTKPDDVKKKKDLIDASKKDLDASIPLAEKVIELISKLEKMKPLEKSNLKQSYGILADAYQVKGNAAKALEYKTKRDAVL